MLSGYFTERTARTADGWNWWSGQGNSSPCWDGKTTLLRILAGLDAPDAGEVRVPEARTVVFQEPRLIQSKKVWRNVVVGLSGAQASRQRALEALAEVELDATL